jgi:hypothetical protein
LHRKLLVDAIDHIHRYWCHDYQLLSDGQVEREKLSIIEDKLGIIFIGLETHCHLQYTAQLAKGRNQSQ